MVNPSTDVNWKVDGVSLATHAYNIETWGGDRQAPPTLRGANLTVPFHSGQAFLPKVPDARTMSFGMWVIGANADGSYPASNAQRALFESNWHTLRALLWQPYRQFTLSKQVVYPDGNLHTVSAQGQYAGGLAPTMTGLLRAEFTVDILLADPYFYGDYITQSIGPSTQFTAYGDARTTRIYLNVAGYRSNPQFTLQQSSGGWPFMLYNGNVNNNDAVSFDVDNAIATYNGNSNRTGLVTSGYAPQWFFLDPGTNVVQGSGAGSGGMGLSYRPAFL